MGCSRGDTPALLHIPRSCHLNICCLRPLQLIVGNEPRNGEAGVFFSSPLQMRLRSVELRMHSINRRRSQSYRPNGGGRGIRTPVTFAGKAVFKTACFNRSHIPPSQGNLLDQCTTTRRWGELFEHRLHAIPLCCCWDQDPYFVSSIFTLPQLLGIARWHLREIWRIYG
jgi:hypothetical protein